MSRLKPSLKRILLLLAVAVAALAQTASQIESDDVKRVGSHLTCQCGACKDNLNCMMSAGQCHFCKPARTKIYNMQASGMKDQTILDSFIKEYGPAMFRPDPNSSFWIVPYAVIFLGVFLIYFIVRKMLRKPAPAGSIPLEPSLVDDSDPNLAKYRDVIEKDLAKME